MKVKDSSQGDVSDGARLILNIGVSATSMCGVRDYARILAEELRTDGCIVETRWLEGPSPRRRRKRWLDAVVDESRTSGAAGIIWHYSVFSYSHRGVPTMVPGLCRSLRRSGTAIVPVLHELAFPWGEEGWRGRVWSATQRAVLPMVVGLSAGTIVTTSDREAWLRTRRWLPSRPVVTAPVFSAVPDRALPAAGLRSGMRIGMFGYSASAAELVLDAFVQVCEFRPGTELWLLGGVGATDSVGTVWRKYAERVGVGHALRFSGELDAADLSDAIRACDVFVFHDGHGPSSRKSTLAAVLAAEKPVVAVDGDQTWRELIACEAVILIPEGNSRILAEGLLMVMRDEDLGREMGMRARMFYDQMQSRKVVGEAIRQFLGELLASRRM